jgi:hypothetical protein
VSIDRSKRLLFKEMMRKVISHYGDDFVYMVRIHAGESPEFYKGIDDRLMWNTLPSQHGLDDIDVLVHCGSTMAYEAHLRGIPAFNYANKMQDLNIAEISPCTNDANTLISMLDNVDITQSNADKQKIETLTTFYGMEKSDPLSTIEGHIDSYSEVHARVPDGWVIFDTPKYLSDGVYINIKGGLCAACGNHSSVTIGVDMWRCPFCGISVQDEEIHHK